MRCKEQDCSELKVEGAVFQELGQLLNLIGSLAVNDSVGVEETVRRVRRYQEYLGLGDAAGHFHVRGRCLLVEPALEEPVALMMHVQCVSGDLAAVVDIGHSLHLLEIVPYEFQKDES